MFIFEICHITILIYQKLKLFGPVLQKIKLHLSEFKYYAMPGNSSICREVSKFEILEQEIF